MIDSVLVFSLQWLLTISFGASYTRPAFHVFYQRRARWPSVRARASEVRLTVAIDVSEDGTVQTFENLRTKQKVTLVGTAHVSEASERQVKASIESKQPDVVVVELDEKRIPRLGLESTDDLGIPFCTADGIECQPSQDDLDATAKKTWISVFDDLLLDALSNVGRRMFTRAYEEAREELGTVPGGDMLAAIKAAEIAPSCKRIVLGDRDSVSTLRRAYELAIRSGYDDGMMARLLALNRDQLEAVRRDVQREFSGEAHSVIDAVTRQRLEDDSDMQDRICEYAENDCALFLEAVHSRWDKPVQDQMITIAEDVCRELLGEPPRVIESAAIERLRRDRGAQERINEQLEREAPDYFRAFVVERDYIMAQSINRELEKGAKHVLVVTGAAHMAGILKNLCDIAREN